MGFKISINELESAKKPRIIRKWSLIYNLTDLFLGLRSLFHTKSFNFFDHQYTIDKNSISITKKSEIEEENNLESAKKNNQKKSMLLDKKFLAHRTQHLQKYIDVMDKPEEDN